jgi:glycosyltransferase involved in cell wall biosynthesis
LISVIIPTLKNTEGLKESIQSVVDQSYQDWELILATEASFPLLPTEFQKKIQSDPRIQVLPCFPNTSKALPYCLAKGIEAAQGSFITFLHPFDVLLPKRFEKSLEFLALNEAKAIYTGSLVQGKNAVYFKDYKDKGIQGTLIDYLFKKDSFKCSSTLIIENSIAKSITFDHSMSQFADFDLMMEVGNIVDLEFFDNADLIEHWTNLDLERIDLLGAISFYRKHKFQSLDRSARIEFLFKLVKEIIRKKGNFSDLGELKELLLKEGVKFDPRLMLVFSIPRVFHYYSRLLNGLNF